MKTCLKERLVTMAVVHQARPLLRFLAGRLRHASDAADLLQELYVRLLRIDRAELIRSPEAYLFTIAAHLASEHTLKQSKQPTHVSLEEAAPAGLPVEVEFVTSDTPEEAAMAADRVRELERVLGQLSPKARAVLIWHRRDGYTYDEIAERIGVSRNMVKKYLAQALAHCRTHIDRGSPR